MIEKYPESQRVESSEVFATFAIRSGKPQKPRRSTRMTRIKRMLTDLFKSAKSAFYRTDSRAKSTDEKVSAVICIHQRFLYDVIFQTGYDYTSVNH